MNKIIDGKKFAENIHTKIKEKTSILQIKYGLKAGLAVILVGTDSASEIYTNNKNKMAIKAGMNSYSYNLPATSTRAEIIAKIEELNIDKNINGILVQLPLPNRCDEEAVINTINPDKDVDGFHNINVGKLANGHNGFIPCTPLGCMMLLKDNIDNLSGKHAVIIGCSNIVGKPMAQLLLQEECTVSITHSKTKNIAEITSQGDILISAAGVPALVKENWIKQNAVIIDVGINRIKKDGKYKIVGDVCPDAAAKKASKYTPVPKGVGPMTIACLLYNTLKAIYLQNGIDENF